MRIALALAFLAISTAAPADPPANTIMKVVPPQDKAQTTRVCIMRVEMEIAQVGHLGAALALDASQKTLFETWKKIHLDVLRGLPCPPPPTGLDVPAPQRMKNQIELITATLEALRKEQDSTAALYDALAPAQRAIFDGPKQGVPPPSPKPDAPPAHP